MRPHIEPPEIGRLLPRRGPFPRGLPPPHVFGTSLLHHVAVNKTHLFRNTERDSNPEPVSHRRLSF
jgi:hypothetical protein